MRYYIYTSKLQHVTLDLYERALLIIGEEGNNPNDFSLTEG